MPGCDTRSSSDPSPYLVNHVDGSPKRIPDIASIADQFDAFLVDVWGVLHDGGTAYPGAVDCLRQLRAAGKAIVIFSNAARRCDAIAAEAAAHGIDSGLYDHIVSSGELVWRKLAQGNHGYGRRCFWLGPARSRTLLRDLDLEIVDMLERSDFILNAGARGNLPDASSFHPLLERAARLGLPMLCANPDRVAIRKGIMGISAGAIARDYAESGGTVEMLGKPRAAMYEAARTLPGIGSTTRLLAVGDGLETDIRGARDAGIRSVFVTGGIHREEIERARGSLHDVCARYGIFPDYASPRFRWRTT
ncbi:MAG: TIGR01459 family HAD-type hydrolase [Proteobacteria bacterium]|nr:MAG: TIGR01459 family HAD-type hydrolase [Pseudomonadota bacterium]